MNKQSLIILMSALGIGLGLNPVTNNMNPGLVKGSAWLISGIISRLLN
jgi:hypothetical protein